MKPADMTEKFPIGKAQDFEVSQNKINEYVAAYQQAETSLLPRELLEVEDLTFFWIEQNISYQPSSAFIIPWYCPNAFYPLSLISVQFHKFKSLPYFFIRSDRLSWSDLKTKSITAGCYFAKDKKAVFKSFSFDYLTDEWNGVFKTFFYKSMGYGQDFNLESLNPYNLGLLDASKKYASALVASRVDEVSISYWQRMEKETRQILHARFLNPSLSPKLEEQVTRIKEKMRDLGVETPKTTHLTFSKIWERNPAEWLKQSSDIINKIDEDKCTDVSLLLRQQQKLFLWLTPQVREGKSVPSVILDSGYGINFDPLDLTSLEGRTAEFWNNVSIDLSFYYDRTIGFSNIQVSKEVFLANCPRYEGDISEGLEFIKAQLMEAVSLREWTLPFGGYFQLAGAVSGLKTYEIGDDVFCVFCFNNGRYFRLIINPALQNVVLPPDFGAVYFEGSDGLYNITSKIDDLKDRALLGLLLIASATIRDAWVVEERESVFGEGRSTRKISPLLGDRRKPIIVYLPRIKYIKKSEDVERATTELNYAVRRQHWVRGHLRKAVKASPAQVLLAQRYGVYIPEGKTYVQGHNRGQLAAERIYRSRSALKCLRALEGIGLGVDGWFAFEKNVKQWLESKGYKTDYKAASRNGDGGIDIQASKGSENLLVQCKYWKDPVGVSVIREMIGTLITYPEGSKKGVIVTSSELTIPAIELAMQHDIQIVQNVSFEKPIDIEIAKPKKEN